MSEQPRRAGVREEKLVLRQAIVAARDCLSDSARAEASREIAARIIGLDRYTNAQVVLAILPYRSEWNATLVIDAALADGKIVAAPRVDRAARMLRTLRIESIARDVEPGYRGIPEPRAGCEEIALDRLDCVLVPGVAFDVQGRRLGYGGGFYDRLLPLLPAAASRIAGAFEQQIVERVPAAPHDVGVDWIVTERRVIHCGRS
jgi:5-formyltetrahydrofolate cyclo-ligase